MLKPAAEVSALKLDRAQIAALIPHSGAMCLLDGVREWDDERIVCISRSHGAPEHPLRVGDILPVLCGVEYAAQAMAVHGGLTALEGRRPRAGYLAALRDVRCRQTRLDQVEGEIEIEAARLMGEAATVIYQFHLRAQGRELLSGRATVVLDVGGAP
ncbi:MAG TPA: 3-hydroxylacyl-ACP dehydratase [Burkholderiales bacterium]|nr:3-hydroxylacyl-ACP dehydratase [Burkholderiales bacterium]